MSNKPSGSLCPEDFLFDSLQTLYDDHPVSITTPGTPFSYTTKSSTILNSTTKNPVTIQLQTPDTAAANWALHASSIWISSIYLADHLNKLELPFHLGSHPSESDAPVRVLELGASAGLPSIVIAKLYPHVLVTATDYPDETLITTLSSNIQNNGAGRNCQALSYAWGTDPTTIIGKTDGFDIVIAADTVWNSELHGIFIDALKRTLRRSSTSRVHVVAGLHTGRYTIQAFVSKAVASGFEAESITESEAPGSGISREWNITREGEDEKERRKWVIWVKLRWADSCLDNNIGCNLYLERKEHEN